MRSNPRDRGRPARSRPFTPISGKLRLKCWESRTNVRLLACLPSPESAGSRDRARLPSSKRRTTCSGWSRRRRRRLTEFFEKTRIFGQPPGCGGDSAQALQATSLSVGLEPAVSRSERAKSGKTTEPRWRCGRVGQGTVWRSGTELKLPRLSATPHGVKDGPPQGRSQADSSRTGQAQSLPGSVGPT